MPSTTIRKRRHRPRDAGGLVQEGWLETVLNRAGTTFRKLADADKQGLDETKAIELMLEQPSMIKRPVLAYGAGKADRRLQAGDLCSGVQTLGLARRAAEKGKDGTGVRVLSRPLTCPSWRTPRWNVACDAIANAGT